MGPATAPWGNLPAIFYSYAAPEANIGMVQFQIRLKIGAHGDGGTTEFVFESHDAIDTDG